MTTTGTMKAADKRLLLEAIAVRLTIFVGTFTLMLLLFWRLLSMELSWVKLPITIAYMTVLTKLMKRCDQDAQEYYNPRVVRIREEYDL